MTHCVEYVSRSININPEGNAVCYSDTNSTALQSLIQQSCRSDQQLPNFLLVTAPALLYFYLASTSLVSSTGFLISLFCARIVLLFDFSLVNFHEEQANANLFESACFDSFSLQFWLAFGCNHVFI